MLLNAFVNWQQRDCRGPLLNSTQPHAPVSKWSARAQTIRTLPNMPSSSLGPQITSPVTHSSYSIIQTHQKLCRVHSWFSFFPLGDYVLEAAVDIRLFVICLLLFVGLQTTLSHWPCYWIRTTKEALSSISSILHKYIFVGVLLCRGITGWMLVQKASLFF